MQDNQSQAPDLPKAPTAKIIRAAEETAWRNGFTFLAEAQRLQAAERALGFAEGRSAGAKDASVLVVETAAKVDRYLASLDGELAGLAFEIIRRVLQDFDDAELVARAARTALAELREAKAVLVQVHPSAEAAARRALADHLSGAETSPPLIAIEADPGLDPRGCVLSTEFAVIDASVEAQLAAIAEAMRPARRGAAE
jgi:type III secretion protein L